MSLYIIDVFTIRTLDSIDSLFEDKFYHEILTANEKPEISCTCGFTKCRSFFYSEKQQILPSSLQPSTL